ncbi:MAG: DNA replication/repair protein RecF [Tessaracoccus sp.]|uniref:DNA replication/repair protein RecF n=1 Tax=Tessaracoccus sp. TaxID=1971211 RepID=UPI001EC327F0|nr:DNA replication/repair protein RecF [Tessaracoccus sp.]MBK7822155.1 DNA replication/repair protein RecF [Tessaracoccus sp.]
MFVTELSLTDFRNYESATLQLSDGVTVFVGANGQGKTNLVEAVEYLSTMSSHRVSSTAPLIRAGTESAVLRARVQAGRDDPRLITLELEVTTGRSNVARLNRAPLQRPRDLIGALRTVVFSPMDLAIVRGDPSDRRGWLDSLVVTRWPRMAGVRQDLDRVLKQRNALLKAMSGRSRVPSGGDEEVTLQVWNEQLAAIGAELLHARLDTLADVLPHAQRAYETIAPVNNQVTATYKTALEVNRAREADDIREGLRRELLDAMERRRRDEIQRGVTLVGPQRDDVDLRIGALPAKGYASHGESWSLALALRLGGFMLVRDDGVEPVLVLDDVFAELDTSRRERLAGAVADAEQVLITAAVGADVPDFPAERRFRVDAGSVTDELNKEL